MISSPGSSLCVCFPGISVVALQLENWRKAFKKKKNGSTRAVGTRPHHAGLANYLRCVRGGSNGIQWAWPGSAALSHWVTVLHLVVHLFSFIELRPNVYPATVKKKIVSCSRTVSSLSMLCALTSVELLFHPSILRRTHVESRVQV